MRWSDVATTTFDRPMRAMDDTWIGVNFWSRAGGPHMWRQFDEAVVAEELALLAEHSLTVTRTFFFWPDFHPEPYRIDEEKCALFARFLDLHIEAGLRTIPTFIVGHMSGQNWDPAWRGGRDLYSDVWMVGRQAWFIGEMVKRFAGHPAVSAWLVSNEMPLYGGGGGLMGPAEQTNKEAVRTWGELMVAAVRAAGGTQPVSLGDGAWGSEVMGQDNGFRLSWTAPLIDWIGPHSYHMSDDPVRQHLIPAFNAELCAPFGRPVVLEEFGVTSEFASHENAADYYRQVLHSTLAAGVTGWLGWNNTDFAIPDAEPYSHHPYEMNFGLTTADGTPKPALGELASFAATVREHDLARARRVASRTGILVSAFLDGDYPFWNPEEAGGIRDSLLEGYIAARLADLQPGFVRETRGIPALPLLLVPATKPITAPAARGLQAAAEQGSTVWVSFCSGESLNQRGWWWPDVNASFGIRQQARYGLTRPVEGDTVTFRFDRDLGDIAAGEEITLPVGGSAVARVMLPVEADDSAVIARDGLGRPAIVERVTGDGRLLLCTYPAELHAARVPFVERAGLVRLYRALGEVSGAREVVSTSSDDVFADLLVHPDGPEFAVVVSQADEPRDVRLTTPRGSRDLSLPPRGATVVPLPTPTSQR
jgi:endo-1,4-beta-mannosidase